MERLDDPIARMAQARLGSTLGGKYRLERVLGIGGMAAVYEARHRNGHRVAVKMLHPTIAAMPDMRKRFLREGYVANAVDHPGALKVLDDDAADDGAPFLVMELLAGQPVPSHQLPPRVALAVAAHLLDVLAAAHARQVIHRDIKPDNVFITEAGELKVLDFGIARFRDEVGEATQTARGDRVSALTSAGALMGTPGFMAPEQALGRHDLVSAATDVFAVGATLHALLSGQVIFDGSPMKIVALTATQGCRPLRERDPAIDPAIAHVVDVALAFDVRRRWPSAAAMRDAIASTYSALFGRALPARVSLTDDEPSVDVLGRTVRVPSTVFASSVSSASIVPPSPSPPSTLPPAARRSRGTRAALALGLLAVAAAAVGSATGRIPLPTAAAAIPSAPATADVRLPGPVPDPPAPALPPASASPLASASMTPPPRAPSKAAVRAAPHPASRPPKAPAVEAKAEDDVFLRP